MGSQNGKKAKARPVYHHKRESIDAHLARVFAALAVTRFIEDRTGWSIKRFLCTARRYRTIQIRVGQHVLTAEDPRPPDNTALRDEGHANRRRAETTCSRYCFRLFEH